jgi:hypothetical protein
LVSGIGTSTRFQPPFNTEYVNSLPVSAWDIIRAVPLWSSAGFLAGIAILTRGSLATMKARRFSNWRKADAEIIESHLTRSTEKDKYGCRSYDPIIRYAYEVEGVKHTADTVAPPDDTSLANKGAVLIQRYPTGKKVVAYHNPQNPAQAFLEVQNTNGKIGQATVGLLMTLAFAYACWHQVGQTQSAPQATVTAVGSAGK